MSRITNIVFFFVFLFFLLCTAFGRQAASSQDSVLDEAYRTAIKDAALRDARNVSQDLTMIDRNNINLVWNKDRSQVLVVTWKSRDSFNRYYRNKKTTDRDEKNVTWVTAAPEVQKFCETFFKLSHDKRALDLRLKQFLGLDPSWNYDVFVEMWVRPTDLFRPCPDPEISDSKCNLDLFDKPPFVRHIKNYNTFFKNLYYERFRSQPMAPWTGLGYTYDWGNPTSKRGASEFIMVPKAQYTLRRDPLTTEEYCSSGQSVQAK